jgi:hypothetical protein
MPNNNDIPKLIIVFWIFFQSGTVFSQSPPKSKQEYKSVNNHLSLNFSIHRFPDESPIIQFHEFGKSGWTNLCFGLEYQRRIVKRHSLKSCVSLMSIDYIPNSYYPTRPGEVIWRHGVYFEIDYMYQFTRSRAVNGYLITGFNWREGEEANIKHIFGSEILATGFYLSDPGLTGGIQADIRLTNHLSLPASLRFTRFFGNYQPIIDPATFLIIKPTMSYIKLQFGISFDF